MTADQLIVAIPALIAALGIGGILQAFIGYLKDRKKNSSDAERIDTEVQLVRLTTVIERLDAEAKRSLAERDRIAEELAEEQTRSSALRKRVRELEDELDEVRRSARETQNTARETQQKCDELAKRLKELVHDSEEAA